MPTYEYACTACGEALEVVQSFTDASLTDCPACGGRLRKVFSAVGVVFKGSGFYKTDSRRTGGSTKPADKGGTEKTEKTGTSEKSEKADRSDAPAEKKSDKAAASTPASTPAAAPAAS